MKKQIGLWIDRRSAVIVTLNEGEASLQRIPSNLRKHVRNAGGTRSKSPYGPRQIMAEDKRENEFLNHLNHYYQEVIGHLRDAESILILGPGEAKTELKKRLEDENLGERIVGVESVDKLTEPQIKAHVKAHFVQ